MVAFDAALEKAWTTLDASDPDVLLWLRTADNEAASKKLFSRPQKPETRQQYASP